MSQNTLNVTNTAISGGLYESVNRFGDAGA